MNRRHGRSRGRRRLALLATVALGAGAAGAVTADATRPAKGPQIDDAATPPAAGTDASPPVVVPPDAPEGADPSEEGSRAKAQRKPERRAVQRVRWRESEAIGSHAAGRLKRGVMLPAEGRSWVSWDPILKRRPNRDWRRWGTDTLVRKTLRVLREFGADHPRAPRVAVGDMSRPAGGDFGPQFGAIGHASHQNGLDVDVYYPRTDERVRPAKRPSQVDHDLAQDLVDRFVAAGAEKIFVGPSLGLSGPSEVVVPLVNHDNHLHFRLPVN